jgi:hypothetical protein
MTLVLAATPGFASPILVSNFSFEDAPFGATTSCGTGCVFSPGAISGWLTTAPVGTKGKFRPGAPGNTAIFNSLSDGPTSAYSNGGTISQVVGQTVQLGEVYTLLVDIGRRKGVLFAGTADLLINGSTHIATGALPALGTFGTFTATYTGLAADVGKSITIQLKSSGVQGNFDNVRLDGVPPGITAVPEPASLTLFGGGLGLCLLLRRRRLTLLSNLAG